MVLPRSSFIACVLLACASLVFAQDGQAYSASNTKALNDALNMVISPVSGHSNENSNQVNWAVSSANGHLVRRQVVGTAFARNATKNYTFNGRAAVLAAQGSIPELPQTVSTEPIAPILPVVVTERPTAPEVPITLNGLGLIPAQVPGINELPTDPVVPIIGNELPLDPQVTVVGNEQPLMVPTFPVVSTKLPIDPQVPITVNELPKLPSVLPMNFGARPRGYFPNGNFPRRENGPRSFGRGGNFGNQNQERQARGYGRYYRGPPSGGFRTPFNVSPRPIDAAPMDVITAPETSLATTAAN